jgi:hypothetical protein
LLQLAIIFAQIDNKEREGVAIERDPNTLAVCARPQAIDN